MIWFCSIICGRKLSKLRINLKITYRSPFSSYLTVFFSMENKVWINIMPYSLSCLIGIASRFLMRTFISKESSWLDFTRKCWSSLSTTVSFLMLGIYLPIFVWIYNPLIHYHQDYPGLLMMAIRILPTTSKTNSTLTWWPNFHLLWNPIYLLRDTGGVNHHIQRIQRINGIPEITIWRIFLINTLP